MQKVYALNRFDKDFQRMMTEMRTGDSITFIHDGHLTITLNVTEYKQALLPKKATECEGTGFWQEYQKLRQQWHDRDDDSDPWGYIREDIRDASAEIRENPWL